MSNPSIQADPGFPGGPVVKNPPANTDRHQRGGFDPCIGGPLKEGTATHSSILAWRIPLAERPGGLHPQGCIESDLTEGLNRQIHTGRHAEC